jgi:hypothetical protein
MEDAYPGKHQNACLDKQVADNRSTGQNRYQSPGNRFVGNDKPPTASSNKSCYICSSNSHLRMDCPHRDKPHNNKGAQDSNRLTRGNKNNDARIFTCSIFNRTSSNDVHCLSNLDTGDEKMRMSAPTISIDPTRSTQSIPSIRPTHAQQSVTSHISVDRTRKPALRMFLRYHG